MATYLDMLSQDPAQRAAEIQALQRIAQLRAQGFSDEEIYGQGLAKQDVSGTNERLGGGYGFLGPAATMAGIASSYKLGRAGVARDMMQDEYAHQGNPFNIVTALQEYADSGQSDLLNNNTLKNIQAGPASRYRAGVDALFSDLPGFGGGNVPPAAAGSAGQAGSYYGFDSPEEAQAMQQYFKGHFYGFDSPEIAHAMQHYFAAGGPIGNQQPDGSQGTPVATAPPTQLGGAGLTTLTPRGTIGTAPNFTTNSTPAGAGAGVVGDPNAPQQYDRTVAPGAYGSAPSGAQTAQMAGARLLGQSLNTGMSNDRFKRTLLGGGVAGLGDLTENDFGDRMNGDQRGAYTGLLQSTGRFSNAAQAIADHFKRYSLGGGRAGAVAY